MAWRRADRPGWTRQPAHPHRHRPGAARSAGRPRGTAGRGGPPPAPSPGAPGPARSRARRAVAGGGARAGTARPPHRAFRPAGDRPRQRRPPPGRWQFRGGGGLARSLGGGRPGSDRRPGAPPTMRTTRTTRTTRTMRTMKPTRTTSTTTNATSATAGQPAGASAPAGSRPGLASLAATAALVTLIALAAFPTPGAPAPPQKPQPPPTPRAAAPPASESFPERVLVREIEVVVELPDSLRESRRKSLGPQDFQVTEDGRFRQVVEASPVMAGGAGPWQGEVFSRRVLAEPETVFYTANALAQRSAQLTALGTVALVVADPAPRILLAETREPKMLEQALTDIAAQAERQRAASSHSAQAPGSGGAATSQAKPATAGPEPEAVRRQEDQLVALLAGRSGGGPRALVLVANGFDTSTSGDGATSATQAVAEEPARTLAAYGWVTFAAPMRRQELGPPHREMTDIERIRQR